MVGILEFFSAPFFSKPLKAEPYRMHWVVGIVYKLGSDGLNTLLRISSISGFVFSDLSQNVQNDTVWGGNSFRNVVKCFLRVP